METKQIILNEKVFSLKPTHFYLYLLLIYNNNTISKEEVMNKISKFNLYKAIHILKREGIIYTNGGLKDFTHIIITNEFISSKINTNEYFLITTDYLENLFNTINKKSSVFLKQTIKLYYILSIKNSSKLLSSPRFPVFIENEIISYIGIKSRRTLERFIKKFNQFMQEKIYYDYMNHKYYLTKIIRR